MPVERVLISRDSFLEPLGLGNLAGRITGRQARERVYELLVDYLRMAGLVEEREPDQVGLAELPLRIPGTPLTVRLAPTSQDSLELMGGLIVAAVGHPVVGMGALTASGVLQAARRIRVSRAQFGERSVLDALAGGAQTAEDVVLALYNRPCRHLAAKCQFLDAATGLCALGKAEASAVLDDLVAQSVVRRRNPVPPIRYSIQF